MAAKAQGLEKRGAAKLKKMKANSLRYINEDYFICRTGTKSGQCGVDRLFGPVCTECDVTGA
jgi:hypothetical protein